VVWVHALFAEGAGESADGVEPDDPGLQLETGVEPGELRETHGGGGGETPAKRLKGVAALFFPFAGSRIYPSRCPYGSNLWKTKTDDLKNRPPVKLFLRLLPAPRRSFHTASRFVRPRSWATPEIANQRSDIEHEHGDKYKHGRIPKFRVACLLVLRKPNHQHRQDRKLH